MPIDNSAAFECADSAFLFHQHCLFSCLFFVFRPNAPLVFVKMCGRIGNEMPRKRKMFGHEKVGSIGQKKKMGTHNPTS